jgi:hypothetical protein
MTYEEEVARFHRQVPLKARDSESLVQWTKEEEKEPEHAKDANAAEIAGTVKNAAHAVSNVAGHVAAGAAVGERLAQGHVVDHSPLARAIRRAQQDSTPEERTERKNANPEKYPQANKNMIGPKAGLHERNKKAAQVKEMRATAQHAQNS